MKAKLTISLDAELLPKVRKYAQARGISLSSLIEQSLRELAIEEQPTFADKWRGEFRTADLVNDSRYNSLKNKYLLV